MFNYLAVFDCIFSWGENTAYIAWTIRASYQLILNAKSGQYFFGRYLINKLAPIIYLWVITLIKKWLVNVDNAQKTPNKSDTNMEYII